jgi:hypothetical protein
MAKHHYTNKLANLLCNISNELGGLWQDQLPTSCTTCWALVLPEPNRLAQWSLSANELYNKFVSGGPSTNLLANKLRTCSYSGVWP